MDSIFQALIAGVCLILTVGVSEIAAAAKKKKNLSCKLVVSTCGPADKGAARSGSGRRQQPSVHPENNLHE